MASPRSLEHVVCVERASGEKVAVARGNIDRYVADRGCRFHQTAYGAACHRHVVPEAAGDEHGVDLSILGQGKGIDGRFLQFAGAFGPDIFFQRKIAVGKAGLTHAGMGQFGVQEDV